MSKFLPNLKMTLIYGLAQNGFITIFIKASTTVAHYLNIYAAKKTKKTLCVYSKRGKIPHPVSIDDRPTIVDTCSRFGDWELDTIFGKNHKQALVTIVERKSRLMLTKKVTRKTADNVTEAIIELLRPFKTWVHILKADNGREFSGHIRIAKQLKTKFYFVPPPLFIMGAWIK